jgi:RNA polymerase sigma factor (sigma-70 family)
MEERNAERPTDVELMEAVVRRDSDAMAAIYQRYESTLRAVILSVLHEEGETDDVLHDVFIQLWNRADRFVAEKGLHGFLVTLARRRALDLHDCGLCSLNQGGNVCCMHWSGAHDGDQRANAEPEPC